MTTAIIGTGGLGSVIARQLASGGETVRLSSANIESARTLAAEMVAQRSSPSTAAMRRPGRRAPYLDGHQLAGPVACVAACCVAAP